MPYGQKVHVHKMGRWDRKAVNGGQDAGMRPYAKEVDPNQSTGCLLNLTFKKRLKGFF